MPILTVAAIQAVFASLYVLYSRSIAKRYPRLQWQQTAMTFVVLYALGLVYVALRGNIEWSAILDPGLVGLFFLNGMFFGLGAGIFYAAFRRLDAADAQTIFLLRIPVAIILSVLLLNQHFTLQEGIGSSIILFGLWLSVRPHAGRKAHHLNRRAAVTALAAALMFGVGLVTEKATLNHVNIQTMILFSWFFEVLLLAIPAVYQMKRLKAALADRIVVKAAVIMGILRFGAGFLLVWLLAHSESTSHVSLLSGMSVLATPLLAALFLRETDRLAGKLAAASIAFAGVMVVFI
jgi:drug/metabolite transporter (DMT)-like permease